MQLLTPQSGVHGGGQQGKVGLQALGLGKGVVLPVGHKVIVLALAQPRHIFAGGAKAVVGRHCQHHWAAHPQQAFGGKGHRRIRKSRRQPRQRCAGAGGDHQRLRQPPGAQRLHRLQGVQHRLPGNGL